MYSAQLLDHFENPRNVGEVEDADGVAELQNPVCGDILRLSAKVRDGRIAELRFRAQGCVPAMACGSCLTELIQGRTLQEAQSLRREELISALGGVPQASNHAGQLAMDALTALLKRMKP